MKLLEAMNKANNKKLYLVCRDYKKMVVKDGILYDMNDDVVTNLNYVANCDWEVKKLIPKINFAKAIKALAEGKTIRSLNSEWEYKIIKDELFGKGECEYEKSNLTESETYGCWEIVC